MALDGDEVDDDDDRDMFCIPPTLWVRSGSGQVCGFDYLLPTTYDLLPTTDYRLPTTDYR